MIEKLWFSDHWLGKVLAPILWPLSLVYRFVSQTRHRAYLNGRKSAYRAPVPVVVVGNITAGGNGKTPVVVWLVERLQQKGFNPGVISRGYGGKSPAYPLLLTENTPVEHCGDEPRLIYQRTGVPVVVDPQRANAVKLLLQKGVDIIIADDGLQHHALARDIEIVVVDGQRRFGNGQFIPYGPLRESIDRLDSVDFVINNGGISAVGEIEMSLAPAMAVNLCTEQHVPVSELNNLVAFAGIGHPARFFHTLSQMNGHLVATQGFADHRDYTIQDLEALCLRGDHVIMTEKDAVKCRAFAKENWWFLPVSAAFHSVDEQRILTLIEEVAEHYGSSFT
ncbi:tetraacyldisaccharide 4'-kinase [Vibrio sp. PP-XX7]